MAALLTGLAPPPSAHQAQALPFWTPRGYSLHRAPTLVIVPLRGVNGCRKKSSWMSYTLGIPSDAYWCLAGWGEKLCTQVHPSEEPCIPNTSSREAMYPKYILPRTMYPKYIFLRSHVSQTRTSEKLCTLRVYFHHLTYITYKHAVHMRCHHENFNHIFSNLFHAYMIFQTSNNQ